MKQADRRVIIRRLSLCLNKAIRGCAPDSTTIFSGCPEVAQLTALVLYRLGYDYVLVRGTALTSQGDRVHHFWIELPGLGLRVETNPSQILGIPSFAAVLDLEVQADRYDAEAEYPELLELMTPAGAAFYGRLAKQVASCVMNKG